MSWRLSSCGNWSNIIWLRIRKEWVRSWICTSSGTRGILSSWKIDYFIYFIHSTTSCSPIIPFSMEESPIMITLAQHIIIIIKINVLARPDNKNALPAHPAPQHRQQHHHQQQQHPLLRITSDWKMVIVQTQPSHQLPHKVSDKQS